MRRIIFGTTERCPRCRLTTRWCVCAGHHEIRCPLAIDVLMHFRERHRPSSTGNLIQRVLPDSRQHLWRKESPPTAGAVQRPGRELWVLHPRGHPAPAGTDPGTVQVLLLDGAWSETPAMVQGVAGWGRLVSLPMSGESRFWLRAQQHDGRFSTAEALLQVLTFFGLGAAHETLRLQFELHVYASLRSRGLKDLAEAFLQTSPLPAAFPELLAQLHARRPLVARGDGKPPPRASADGGDASGSSAASLTGGRQSKTGATGRTDLNVAVNLEIHPTRPDSARVH